MLLADSRRLFLNFMQTTVRLKLGDVSARSFREEMDNSKLVILKVSVGGLFPRLINNVGGFRDRPAVASSLRTAGRAQQQSFSRMMKCSFRLSSSRLRMGYG